MITRYSLPELAEIWTDRSRFSYWLKVELAACKAMAEHKLLPMAVVKRLAKKVRIDEREILANEALVKHDVIAFTMAVEKQVGDDAKYFHYGLTSSDIVDTAFALQLRDSLQCIITALSELKKEIKKLALKAKKIPAVGRTHGIHAEPLSFGYRFLSSYAELCRAQERLEIAKKNICYGKFSGAVGAYGTLSPKIERRACAILGLQAEPMATQIIPRDRHAEVFTALALLGCSIERLAIELRHLQRTEVGEVEEGFSKQQKGSSAMPHKKNPISAENLTGCARLLRSYAQAALENIALWHERDISHSSVERVIGPDATILAHYMLVRMQKLIAGLQVNKTKIHSNLQYTQGLVYSGAALLALVEAGLTRDQAYRLVQRHALEAWKGGKTLMQRLLIDAEVLQYLKKAQIKEIFSEKRGLEHVEEIYRRVLRGH